MNTFLFWLLAILLALAGYLAYLWWHPQRRSRFQVRLTAIFLLFSLAPTLPLVFLASTLATDTADVLLIPEIETAMLKAVEALKAQCEDTGKKLARACEDSSFAAAIISSGGLDYYFKWRRAEDTLHLVTSLHGDGLAPKRVLAFNEERAREVWGQTGSEVEAWGGDSALLDTAAHCRVWLPQGESEMVVLGYALAPQVLAAKSQLTQTMRIYNALSLIKEKALQDQLIWGAATTVVLILSALSVFAARRLSRRLSSPIEDLIGVTHKVAAGDLEVQAHGRAQDEIGQLREAFNKMIRDLRANREKLLAAERLAAWREVARQVSHEIKNPLTPIQLALYRVRQKLGDTLAAHAEVQESFQSIEEELSSLRRLAEEFSSFARLPKAQVQPEDLNEIIQSAARLYETGVAQVRFRLDLDQALALHPLDRELIKRLLNNLIKNAVEAMPLGPAEVTIVTRTMADKILMEISDNGPGLSPEALAHLFQPNFTTKRGGSGLGLAMVKRIVEEHGAEISVQSQPGRGTVFRILW